MPARFRTFQVALAAALAAGAIAAAPAFGEAQPPRHTQQCFSAHDWQGWKSPRPDVIYIRVFLHDVYQLNLSSGSNELEWPDMHLVTVFHGSDYVCSPLDFEMWVSDNHGFREPLIVKSYRKLTPAEVAAIPPKFRP